MSTNEPLFNETQQADMRDLLETLRAYFLETSGLFAESEVLVGPNVCSVVVPIGLVVAGDSLQASEANNARAAKLQGLKAAVGEFWHENYRGGGPILMQYESGDEHLIIRFRLVPNDILGAEQALNRVLKRLRLRHSETVPA